ncbi:hypothetical protein EXIGLDRAFT_673831 [Exidia glandulosa HHB12029]|uniref:CxC1-like cysteine cluster associated with KDZ transposases domain-containing protein n=1 Tax=Exidia glandulosa HHB12029 TaxID=1314781 RepID=A0A165IQ36_EXIGL|nr:hypothetical protein EXIGLDRAFT_673831 [Exidia glandulosa HHB12029]
MKPTKVKSSFSSKVTRLRLDSGKGDGGKPGVSKEVYGPTALQANEERWAAKRAEHFATTGDTMASRLAALDPDDDAEGRDDGDYVMHDETDNNAVNALQDNDQDNNGRREAIRHLVPAYTHRRRWWAQSHVHYVKPRVSFKRYDPRTWADRLKAQALAWSIVMPTVVEAYIAWCNEERASPSYGPPVQEAGDLPPAGASTWQISAVYEQAFVPVLRVVQAGTDSPAVALIRMGLLPCTPQVPSVAISLALLDWYYRLRRHAPRLGVQQFVKALCDMHDRPYQRYLRDQFALAFDTFLAIRREVDARVRDLLQRSAPHWRVKNSCPPCRYKLDDEPVLLIPAMIGSDGNFALKRSAAAGSADARTFASDYKIEDESIDLYANEVPKRTRVTPVHGENAKVDDVTVEELEESGEPGDDAAPTPCVLRWKAAKAEQNKTAPDMFEQTGIYVAICRHGMVLYYCEIRKSGELAKYPLGTYARVMEAGLTPLTAASDIGCALQGTLMRSPMLGALAKAKGLQVRMNSFHGYGHNRLCQVTEHPLYIEGFGLEDLEICERFFSASNHVAGQVRHASHFHYSQFIDMFMQTWDEEKYAALSSFLCGNAIQAYEIVDDYKPVLDEFKRLHNLTDVAIEAWRFEEKAYLESLKAEPSEDVFAMDYVEALIELQETKSVAADALVMLESGFIVVGAEDLANAGSAEIAKRMTKKRKARAAYISALANVETLERILKVEVQWSPESDAYKVTLEKIRLRDYMRAVDHLEFLLLQRVFELSKTHALGTGYKMREAISKNIKSRSKAIANAVKKYNTAAAAVVPPAPSVDFSKLMEWTELQEFDLLRMSRRGDVREREWAKPANRELAQKYYKVKRAQEEIQRCEIELHRLVTAIHDEEAELDRVHGQLLERAHPLAGEVARISRRRSGVNAQHIARIVRLAALPGMARFARCLVPGTREGTSNVPSTSSRTPSAPTAVSHEVPTSRVEMQDADEGSSDEGELDDEEAEQMLLVQDFIGQLDT